MKLVIPCAGRGTRLDREDVPKPLINICGTTMLDHVVSPWRDAVDSYVIIVSPDNETLVKDYVWSRTAKVEFVVQKEPLGLADAVSRAEPLVDGLFVVTLGDCLYRGTFQETTTDLGIGVWKTSNRREIAKNYLVGVGTSKQLVASVTEKATPMGLGIQAYCGMGVYFLDPRVFKYIRDYRGITGGGDLTNVIQHMIDAGEKVSPIWFEGEYINVNYPMDIEAAECLFTPVA